MKPIRLFLSLFLFSFFTVWLLALSGCGIGSKQNEWESGMFSSDGRYYAYTYDETTVLGTTSTGRSGSGFLKHYFQIIDLSSGEKLLEKPYRTKGMSDLQEIEGNYIWLNDHNLSNNMVLPVLFDLQSRKMKFDAEELQKTNPGILAKSIGLFYKSMKKGTVCVEAADGRKYRIDPTTGKATLSTGDFEPIKNKSEHCYQTEGSPDGYRMTGDTRQKITKTEGEKNLSSQDDFINPQFLAIDKKELTDNSTVTYYNDCFFILSDNATDSKKDRQLTMLNKNTLQTKWSIALPQNQQNTNYDNERFFLKGNQLCVANSTHLLVIDADKGTLTKTIKLLTSKKTAL